MPCADVTAIKAPPLLKLHSFGYFLIFGKFLLLKFFKIQYISPREVQIM